MQRAWRNSWRASLAVLLLAGTAFAQPAKQRRPDARTETAPGVNCEELTRRICLEGPSDCSLACPAPSSNGASSNGSGGQGRCLQCLENQMACMRLHACR